MGVRTYVHYVWRNRCVKVNVHIFMCVHVLAAKQGRWACVNILSVCECHDSKREQQPLCGHLPFHFACA